MPDTPKMHQSVETMARLLATSTDSGKSLRVPEYQRCYAWRKRQYEEFWEDLAGFADDDSRSDRMYFMGIVVFVDAAEPEILDGQQRLSTTTILLTSIARFLQDLGEEEYANDIIKGFVVGSDLGGGNRTYRLILNSHDKSYFRNLIQDGTEPTSDGTRSHSDILACKRFFDRKLRDWAKPSSDEPEAMEEARVEAVAKAKRLAESLLYRVYVVSITAFGLNEAGYVFEHLNDRGVGLSSVDLVRSWVMQNCDESDRDEILENWGGIFQVQGRGSVDDLLRFHWIMRWGDRSNAPQHTLIKREFTKKDPDPAYTPKRFSSALRRSAAVYESICNAKVGKDTYWDVASWVAELDVKPLFPMLMKLHEFADAEHRDLVADVAFTAFVRNRLVGNQSSTSFEDIVYRVTRDLTMDEAGVQTAVSELDGYTYTDDDFRRAFLGRALPTQRYAKFLLRGIESFLQREDSGGRDELVLGSSANVQLEHIYPKKPMEGHEWDDGANWVNRLGNMTLLAKKLNGAIQNRPFPDKKPHYKESKLQLTKQLLPYSDWSQDEIENRQRWMADLAVKVWPKHL